MCLDEITHKRLRKTEGIGYKVFVRQPRSHVLHFWYRSFCDSTLVPLGEWLQAANNQNSYPPYTIGFHIFPTLKDARLWVINEPSESKIVRVRYQKARLQGLDGGAPVLIADEMFVPKKYQMFPRTTKKRK